MRSAGSRPSRRTSARSFSSPSRRSRRTHDKKPIAYDWCLHVPGGRRSGGRRPFGGDSELADTRATLTIYISEPLPLALAGPQTARRWIADLDSNDFKTREQATKELAALGPPVASLLREALTGCASLEDR